MKRNIFKSRKGILMILMVLVLSIAILMPTAMSAFASTHPLEQLNGDFGQTEYQSLAEAVKGGKKLNQRIVEEGTILLKNDGKMLPFGKDVKNISVFGKRSVNLATIAVAGPRSEVSVPSYSVQDSLTSAGYNINPFVEDFYKTYSYPQFTYESRPGQTGETQTVTSSRFKASLLEPDVDEFSVQVRNSFRGFSDAAVIILSREVSSIAGADANSWRTNNVIADSTYHPDDHDNHALQLNHSEKELVDFVAGNFDNVVVIVQAHSPMELDYIKEHDGVSSMLNISTPGTDGIMGLGRILNGEINPSGKTANMHANQKLSPVWQNIHTGRNVGGNATWSNMPTGVDGSRLYNFEEGIYTGSHYFETRGYELAKAAAFADGGRTNLIDADWAWYDEAVTYPLGYGMSYSKFDWEVVDNNIAVDSTLSMNDEITIKVKVTNTGFVAGQDVVQLYYTTPYISGGVESAFVVMKDYAKTRVLNPGGSQTLSLNVRVKDMASWDWNNLSGMGANPDGSFGAWIINAGQAQVRIMRDSNIRNEEYVANYTIPATVPGGVNSAGNTMPGGLRLNEDAHSGNAAKNRFTLNKANGEAIRLTEGMQYKDGDGNVDPDLLARRQERGLFNTFGDYTEVLSREFFGNANLETSANWISPTMADTVVEGETVTNPERIMSDVVYEYRDKVFNPDDPIDGDIASQPWYKTWADIPSNWTQRATVTEGNTINGRPVGEKTAIQYLEMGGVSFNDPEWDDFLNQMTVGEMVALLNSGGWGTGRHTSFEALGMPRVQAADGAIGIGNFNGTTGGNNGLEDVSATAFGTAFGDPVMIAQTYNKDLMYQVGRQTALEGQHTETQNMYSLTFDIRRSQIGTRVWEGCSEDPYIIGMFGTQYVLGSQEAGAIVFIKHFLGFSGADHRTTGSIFMTEQTLRERFAAPFRMATVKELGGALAFMEAYTSTGIVGSFQNYALNVELVKDEWDFQGILETDSQSNAITGNGAKQGMKSALLSMRAGCDNFMSRSAGFDELFDWNPDFVRVPASEGVAEVKGALTFKNPVEEDSTFKADATSYYWVRNAAKRMLYANRQTHVFLSSPYLYKDAMNAWLERPDGFEGNWNAPAKTLSEAAQNAYNVNINVGLASDQTDLVPEGSSVSYRLAYGSTLPNGLTLSEAGYVKNQQYSTSGPGGNLPNLAENKGTRVSAESSTTPHTFQVEMLLDNKVRTMKTFELPLTSAFVLGDGFTAAQDINSDDVANGVAMHLPYTNLTVGKAFDGQIQGEARAKFHTAGSDPSFQNIEGTGITTDFSLVSGSLPAGLTLTKEGAITGTPIASGQFDYTIRAHRMNRESAAPGVRVKNEEFLIHATMVVGSEGSTSAGGGAWSFGTSAPVSTDGSDGDLYLNFTNSTVYKKVDGAWASQGIIPGTGSGGTQGPKGDAGSSMLNGTAAPAASTGSDGDLYLNTTTYDLYAKASGAWTKVGNIQGADGLPGSAGTLIAHIRINTTTGNWEVSSDGVTWEDTTVKAQGPQGTPGAAGQDGQSIKGDKGDPGEAGGCNSTIAGTSIAFALVLVGLAAFVIIKRKAKNN